MPFLRPEAGMRCDRGDNSRAEMHGGAPVQTRSAPCPRNTREKMWVGSKGCENLIHHIETVKKAGIRPVVCINSFYTDTKAEIAGEANCGGSRRPCAVSEHWLKGGDGALELAEAVVTRAKKRMISNSSMT